MKQIFWAGFKLDENLDNSSILQFFDQKKPYFSLLESGIIKLSNEEKNSNLDNNTIETSVDEKEDSDNIFPEYYYETGIGFLDKTLYTYLELDLPFSDLKKAEKILPMQVKDYLPFDLPASHHAIQLLCPVQDEKYKYSFTSIKKDTLSSILNDADRYNLKLCGLYPSEAIAWPFLYSATNLQNKDEANLTILLFQQLNDISISISKDNKIIHSRNLKVSNSDFMLEKQIEAQIAVSLSSLDLNLSEISNFKDQIFYICLNNENSILKNMTGELNPVEIEPEIFIKNTNIHNLKSFSPFIFSTAFMISFDFIGKSLNEIKDSSLSKQKYPNIRSGEFRYRAPLTEIKNSLTNEIIPFSLLIIFGLLTLVFSFLSPIKQHNLDKARSNEIASKALNQNVPMGHERSMLDSRIIDLEDQLGDMSSVQSLSPTQWLETISRYIPESIPLEIKSISITTSGLSFRGTVPDYPTSGKISTILENIKSENPDRFCDTNIKTDDVAIGVAGKQITAEILLCE